MTLMYRALSPLLRQLHWLKAPERIQYKLAVLVYMCLNGMAPSYLADEFLQPADLNLTTGFVRYRHCSFAVHGCRLSATERVRSLLPVFGTVCRVMSPPLHRCLSTVAAWRVTFSSSPSRYFYSCSACAVTLISDSHFVLVCFCL